MRSELLIVEDAEIHLSILSKIAEQAGFNVTGVGSVDGAAEILEQRGFDCISLDLSLHERSGAEILTLLADRKYRGPIVIVTGYDDEQCAEAVRVGASLDLDVYPPFVKPVDFLALSETLKRIASEAAASQKIR
jgi:DNA-binding NtrC family response regulator